MKKEILSDDVVSVFCLEMAQAIKSGITVSESFMLLAEQIPTEPLKTALMNVYELTDAGEELSAAMKEQEIFPDHAIKMLAVAEQTGHTEAVFSELSIYYKRKSELKSSLRSAVLYPIVLLVIILAVFFVFITQALPIFSSVYSQIGAQMTPIAEFFMNLGVALSRCKWVILAIVAVIILFFVVAHFVPALHKKVSGAITGIFSRGKTGKSISLAQLASVISLSVAGTRDIGEALELAIDFSKGSSFESGLTECLDAVTTGGSFARTAESVGLFEPMYCRMISIGEKTGSIDTMMKEISDRTQADMEKDIRKMTERVEPIAVVILSLCVGLLLLSVMLPLVGIMSAL
jgi:type IV pilus assembly protein PilC